MRTAADEVFFGPVDAVDAGRRQAAADVEAHRPPVHFDTVEVLVGFFVQDPRVVQLDFPDDKQPGAVGLRVLQPPPAVAERGFADITPVFFRGTAERVDAVLDLAATVRLPLGHV